MSVLTIRPHDMLEAHPTDPNKAVVRRSDFDRFWDELDNALGVILAKIGLNEDLTVVESQPGENVIAVGVLYRIVEDVPNRLIQVDRRLGADSWGRENIMGRNA